MNNCCVISDELFMRSVVSPDIEVSYIICDTGRVLKDKLFNVMQNYNILNLRWNKVRVNSYQEEYAFEYKDLSAEEQKYLGVLRIHKDMSYPKGSAVYYFEYCSYSCTHSIGFQKNGNKILFDGLPLLQVQCLDTSPDEYDIKFLGAYKISYTQFGLYFKFNYALMRFVYDVKRESLEEVHYSHRGNEFCSRVSFNYTSNILTTDIFKRVKVHAAAYKLCNVTDLNGWNVPRLEVRD